MKGYIHKNKDGWVIREYDGKRPAFKEHPLHPDDVNQILEDGKLFDNIEGRIKCYSEVKFYIVTQCKMSGDVSYAKLF